MVTWATRQICGWFGDNHEFLWLHGAWVFFCKPRRWILCEAWVIWRTQHGITVGLDIGCSWAWPMKMNASGCLKGIWFQFLMGLDTSPEMLVLKRWSWSGNICPHFCIGDKQIYGLLPMSVLTHTHTHTRTWNIIHHKLQLHKSTQFTITL